MKISLQKSGGKVVFLGEVPLDTNGSKSILVTKVLILNLSNFENGRDVSAYFM